MSSVPREEPRRAPLAVPLLLALAAMAITLLASASRDFWAPDEPDFAEHVREMIERRNLLIPYENGRPYSEKPILFYWAVAATTPVSGGDVSPFASRLPSILAGGFLVFGAAALAGRRGGNREALLAGGATAVAPLVFWQCQFVQVDALFTALLFGALVSYLMIEEDAARAGAWCWALHLLVPLAVLTKGPLGAVLVGLVVLVEAAARRSTGPILAVKPIRAVVVFVLLVVPWYVAASLSGGRDYAYDLVVRQNLVRFFHAFDHIKPFWFYGEAIWGDFFPFTLPALAAGLLLWKRGFASRPDVRRAAVIVVSVFVFLSLSQSKQGKYLLVAYPFAAVVLAAGVSAAETHGGAALRFQRLYAVFIAAVLFGAALALIPVARVRVPRYAPLAPLVAAPLGLGALGTFVVLARRRKEVAPAFLALAATLGAGEAATAAAVFPAVDVQKTGRPLYERLAPSVSHGEPLVYYGETYHCYPLLVLRRKTDHARNEAQLVDWISRHPDGRVLADKSAVVTWVRPELRALTVLDRQRVGGDEAFVLARP